MEVLYRYATDNPFSIVTDQVLEYDFEDTKKSYRELLLKVLSIICERERVSLEIEVVKDDNSTEWSGFSYKDKSKCKDTQILGFQVKPSNNHRWSSHKPKHIR